MYIYKIYHQDNPVISYVGQTAEHPEVRLYQHWADRNKKIVCGIAGLMREYPRHQFKIEVLEICRQEVVRQREQYWIEKEGMLNLNNAIQDETYQKKYQQDNKPWLKREKEIHNLQEKEYYQRNKDNILEKRKSQKVVCECGYELTKQHLARHKKGLLHELYLNQKKTSSS